MTVTIVDDRQIRFVNVEHKCNAGSGGGSTYRAQYIEVPWGEPYLSWSGFFNQNNCAYCGEKLPKHPDEIK